MHELKNGEKWILSVLLNRDPEPLGILELKSKTSQNIVERHLRNLYDDGLVWYDIHAERGRKRPVKLTSKFLNDVGCVMGVELWKLLKKVEKIKSKDVDNKADLEVLLKLYEDTFLMILDVCWNVNPDCAYRMYEITNNTLVKVAKGKLQSDKEIDKGLERLANSFKAYRLKLEETSG